MSGGGEGGGEGECMCVYENVICVELNHGLILCTSKGLETTSC